MPKLIKKNNQYYIRAPYDFALRPEGVNELSSKDIEVNDVFDKEFFNYLCDRGWVAIFRETSKRLQLPKMWTRRKQTKRRPQTV
jgi:hypothetical protein